jgi:hypothetical protein
MAMIFKLRIAERAPSLAAALGHILGLVRRWLVLEPSNTTEPINSLSAPRSAACSMRHALEV